MAKHSGHKGLLNKAVHFFRVSWGPLMPSQVLFRINQSLGVTRVVMAVNDVIREILVGDGSL